MGGIVSRMHLNKINNLIFTIEHTKKRKVWSWLILVDNLQNDLKNAGVKIRWEEDLEISNKSNNFNNYRIRDDVKISK